MTDAADINLGLKDRVVLVTGGVRGVGAGISAVFADQGVDRAPRHHAKVRRTIEAQGAGEPILVDAQIGDRNRHVQADL